MLLYADNYSQGRLFFLKQNGNAGTFDLTEFIGNPPTSSNSIDLTTLTGASARPAYHVISNIWTAQNGYVFSNSLDFQYPMTGLAGFQDTASPPTHHVFYYGTDEDLHEMYAHDDTNSSWYDHVIPSAPNEWSYYGENSLVALWDGAHQHVYTMFWNFASSYGLSETYYSGAWYVNNDTGSFSTTPAWSMTAFSPATDYQDVIGSGQSTSGNTLEDNFCRYDYVPYTWLDYTEAPISALTNFNPPMVSFTWRDGSTGIDNTGVNAGVFYVGSDSNVYEYLPATGQNVLLSYYATTFAAANQWHVPNEITGFNDGTTVHVFYPDSAGYIVELYAAASSMSNGSGGSWNYHRIGGGGSAAH